MIQQALRSADFVLLRHFEFERAMSDAGRAGERLLPAASDQAEHIAQLLRDSQREVIFYASPQPRAVQSAELLSRALELPVYVDPDLAELRLGRDPDLEQSVTAQLWQQARSQPGIPALPGAETFAALAERAAVAIAGAVEANPGRLVVGISHGGLIEAMLDRFGFVTDERNAGHPLRQEIHHGALALLRLEPPAVLAFTTLDAA